MVLDEVLKQGGVPDGMHEVEVEFFQFKNTGDHINGKLLNKTIVTMGRGNKCGKYKVLKTDGKLASFLGSVELDDKMADIPVQSTILVEYKGAEKIAGTSNEIKHFRVYLK